MICAVSDFFAAWDLAFFLCVVLPACLGVLVLFGWWVGRFAGQPGMPLADVPAHAAGSGEDIAVTPAPLVAVEPDEQILRQPPVDAPRPRPRIFLTSTQTQPLPEPLPQISVQPVPAPPDLIPPEQAGILDRTDNATAGPVVELPELADSTDADQLVDADGPAIDPVPAAPDDVSPGTTGWRQPSQNNGGSRARTKPLIDETERALAAQGTIGFCFDGGDELKPFTLEYDSGMIIAWSGENARVFKVRTRDDHEFVVKVFKSTDNRSQLQEVYGGIDEYIRRSDPEISMYFCPATFLPDALRVNTSSGPQTRDVVVMPYQKRLLNQFIADYYDNPGRSVEARVRFLARNFRVMAEKFHVRKIVHGDYKLENIAIALELEPLLLDQDAVATKSYQAALDMEGSGGFQPGARLCKKGLFESEPWKIDYFSECVIYLHLVLCVEMHPALTPPQRDAAYAFVDDFEISDPLGEARILPKLIGSDHPIIGPLARHIHLVCMAQDDTSVIRPLEELCTREEFERWEGLPEAWIDAAEQRRQRQAAMHQTGPRSDHD